jgi:cyanate lyase
MTREELTLKIQSIKRTKKLTWKQIAAHVGTASPIVTTAALFGQMRLSVDEAAKAAENQKDPCKYLADQRRIAKASGDTAEPKKLSQPKKNLCAGMGLSGMILGNSISNFLS